MSKKDRKTIQTAVDSQGIKLSNWIRSALLDAANVIMIKKSERKAEDSNLTAADTATPGDVKTL